MLKISTFSLSLIQCLSNQTTVQSSSNVQLSDIKNDPNLAFFIKGLKFINTAYVQGSPTNQRSFTIPNIKFSTTYEAKRISGFFGATYYNSLILANWNCVHCKKAGDDIQVQCIFDEPILGSRGFLTSIDFRKQVIVSFRSSYNSWNRIADFQILLTLYSVENSDNDIYVQSELNYGIKLFTQV